MDNSITSKNPSKFSKTAEVKSDADGSTTTNERINAVISNAEPNEEIFSYLRNILLCRKIRFEWKRRKTRGELKRETRARVKFPPSQRYNRNLRVIRSVLSRYVSCITIPFVRWIGGLRLFFFFFNEYPSRVRRPAWKSFIVYSGDENE